MKILTSIALLVGSLLVSFSQTNVPLTTEFISSGFTLVSDTSDSDVGVFTVKFSVTAVGSDLYLGSTAIPSLESGFNWSLSQDSTGLVRDSSSAVILNSGGTADANFFQINEGDSGVFSLVATIEPQVNGFYGVELQSIDWTTSLTIPETTFTLDGFETGVLFLEASQTPEPSTFALVALGVGSLLFFRRKRP